MEYIKTINNKKLIKLVVLSVITALAIYLSFQLVNYVLPFVLAYLFSFVLKYPIEFLEKKLRFKRGLATLLCTLVFFSVIGTVFFFIVIALINQISSLASNLPKLINDITRPLSSVINSLNNLSTYFPYLSAELSAGLSQFSDSLISSVASIARAIGSYIVSTAISIPGMIVFLVITILSTYFYSKDKKHFKDLVSKQLPDAWIERFYENRKQITGTLTKWLKAQGIILSITFLELLTGFTIIGVEYALLLSIIIALIDILPVLGTGTVMIPWIVFSFISGNSSLGIKLLILYIIEISVRQILEPKFVSKEIGLHPLVTLFSMYIGVHFFGILGFLLGPIYVMIYKIIMLDILDGKKIIEYINHRTRAPVPEADIDDS